MANLPDIPVYNGKPAEVLIVGFGAVGIIYGYLLEKYKRARVTAIARSTFNAINEKGITIHSTKWGTVEGWRPSRVARSIDEVLDIEFDYVVVTTKAIPEIKTTPQILEPLLNGQYRYPQPTYVLLQNGINVEKDLYAALKQCFDEPLIISCALYIMTNVTTNGDVTHGSFEEIKVGIYKPEAFESTGSKFPISKSEQETVDRWIEIITSSNSQASAAPNVFAAKWSKNIWNASFGMVCTLLRLTPTEWSKDEAALARALSMVRQVMDEVMVLGRAMGYDESLIPQNTPDIIMERSLALLKDSDFVFSALLDVRLGKPFENEVILGEVVRQARKRNISIPLVEFMYTALTVVQADLLHSSSAGK